MKRTVAAAVAALSLVVYAAAPKKPAAAAPPAPTPLALDAGAADAGVAVEPITSKAVRVEATNSDWTRTTVRVEPGDMLVIIATGRAHVGAWTGDVRASTTGIGQLELAVGPGAPERAVFGVSDDDDGDRNLYIAKSKGAVKLRVADTDRSDNSGGYEVLVVKLPRGTIPPPTPVADED